MDEWFIIREILGALAILCGIKAKWDLGSHKISGWLWGVGCSILWFGFSLLIGSPISIINTIVYFYLSIRGYFLWKESGKYSGDSGDQ